MHIEIKADNGELVPFCDFAFPANLVAIFAMQQITCSVSDYKQGMKDCVFVSSLSGKECFLSPKKCYGGYGHEES